MTFEGRILCKGGIPGCKANLLGLFWMAFGTKQEDLLKEVLPAKGGETHTLGGGCLANGPLGLLEVVVRRGL
eukprot:5810228-Prorocentrum_lima.AAC.1